MLRKFTSKFIDRIGSQKFQVFLSKRLYSYENLKDGKLFIRPNYHPKFQELFQAIS